MSRSLLRPRAGIAWRLALPVMLLAPAAALGARTMTWTASPETLARGEADGVAVSRRGRLSRAPELTSAGREGMPGEPAHVWAVAAGTGGRLFLGTGPEGRVIEIDAAGRARVLYTVDEPMVTALAVTRDGDIYAGTAPGGRVYRIRADGTGEVLGETGDRYVWSLAVGPQGELFAGTGEQGTIVRIHRSGSTEIHFDSDESHIVSLQALEDGSLLAGGAGRGLIYRVDRDGNALVLHDGDLPEVVALIPEPDGSVVAAYVAPPEPPADRPALKLRLPDGVQVGASSEGLGALEETGGSVLRGVIEGLPERGELDAGQIRGRVVRVGVDGETTELWSSPQEAPFSLVRVASGRIYFGTGEPARIRRVEPDGDVAVITTLRESQVTGLLAAGNPGTPGSGKSGGSAGAGDSIVLVTSNPAAAYRLESRAIEPGVFVCPAFDAGGPARWGSIRWIAPGDSGRAEMYTRTGNSREPDASWSAWSPAMTGAEGSPIVNPDGRFLQWRLRLVGGPSTAHLEAVTVHYEPYNRAPVVREFRLDPERTAVSGEARFRWKASDPDRDPVELFLEHRARGSREWIRSTARAEGGGLAHPDGVEGWRRDTMTWDTTDLAEGVYEVRGVASDETANHPGEGRRVEVEPARLLTVDRTPPEIEVRRIDSTEVEVAVSDTLSGVRRLELTAGDELRSSLRPEDGVCDSEREVFRFEPPEGTADEAAWTLRGVDGAGNVTETALGPTGAANGADAIRGERRDATDAHP